ncbi:MAG: hypothetical protein K6B68_02300 [Eubacterium sp.]|nr:hypothetical protein [Eubacterium sp.]
MKKRITEYLKYIDDLLAEDESDKSGGHEIDWDKEIEKHLNQIAFFSHERLVHLIVFSLVAVCTIMCFLALIVSEKIIIFPLLFMLFVLLVPYCMHYYLLENSVQKMYDQYDSMIGKKEAYFKVINTK